MASGARRTDPIVRGSVAAFRRPGWLGGRTLGFHPRRNWLLRSGDRLGSSSAKTSNQLAYLTQRIPLTLPSSLGNFFVAKGESALPPHQADFQTWLHPAG